MKNLKEIEIKIDWIISTWKDAELTDELIGLKNLVSDIRKETAECEREKIKQNIGLLRQWLNERTDSTELITNKELETFLLKEL